MKLAIRFCVIGLLLAAGLAVALEAWAQPPCPPGFRMQPGIGCVRIPPPPPPPPIPPAELMRVASRRLNVRQCPTPQCPPVASLSRGTPVRILNAQGPWVRIRVPQAGIEGWVQRQFLVY